MSPARNVALRPSASVFKPYFRSITLPHINNKSTNAVPLMPAVSQAANSQQDRPGFPTRAQYENIEATYFASLTPKRQPKALISRDSFNRIWNVLKQTEAINETPQFRFWVRKTFTIAKASPEWAMNPKAPEDVLMHDGLLVAVREQIYDLLCYSHGAVNHAGRDRTCAILRRRYTWIPKELVSQFVKVCPTCALRKRSNNAGGDAVMDQKVDAQQPTGSERVQPISNLQLLPALRNFLRELSARDASHAGTTSDINLGGTSTDAPVSSESTLEALLRNEIPRSQEWQHRYPNNLHPGGQLNLESLPMAREVSLYQGLPNGWQYNTDYMTAHETFMRSRNEGFSSGVAPSSPSVLKRPRVPSIAPLILPALSRREPRDKPEVTSHLPATVGPLMNEDRTKYVPQIDPALLALSDFSFSNPFSLMASLSQSIGRKSNISQNDRELIRRNAEVSDIDQPYVQPSTHPTISSRRLGVHPTLHLETVKVVTERTYRTQVLQFRETDGGVTSGGSSTLGGGGEQSPNSISGSEGVTTSNLSSLPMTTSNSSSAENSALPTPSDETGGGATRPFVMMEGKQMGDDVSELVATAAELQLTGAVQV